jgi:transcriptional regulator with XRE-family HTH domain
MLEEALIPARGADLTMKARRTDGAFGERLAAARQRRGLTQAELGKAVGVSQRVVAYYESEGGQPPGALLADLARVLRVTSDELLGLTASREATPVKIARLRKRLQKVESLPAADQRTVLKLVDALAEARQRFRPRPRRQAS